MPIPYTLRGAARGDARADRAQRPAAPATSARSPSAATGDGPQPARRAGRRRDRGLAVGRLPRRRGASATACARRSRSWRRISADSLIPHAKASGQYLNSVLAKIESHKAGYEEAILLDEHGFVCEGTGENIFVVRDGVICTPPQTAAILDGINRDVGHPDRARRGLRGRRARHRARRALPRRRGLHDGHRRRADADPRDRRPRDRRRRARAGHDARAAASSRTRCTGAIRATTAWNDVVAGRDPEGGGVAMPAS